MDWFSELAPLEGGDFRLVRDRDIIPYLAASDLLVTDISSVAVEYTLLDRPIVFMDIPSLMKKVRKRAPALDLETYGRKIGRVVGDVADLEGVVRDAFAHPEKKSALRRRMARHVFHAPGRASVNVAGVVRYAAGLVPGPPEGVVVL